MTTVPTPPPTPTTPQASNLPATVKARQPTLAELIVSRRSAFADVAAKHYDADRLVKLAQVAIARSPKLAACTAPSVLLCLMRCAELGLEPDSALPTRRMWLVPRWNNKLKATEATFVIDYRAQIQLARDTGLVKSFASDVVRLKDKFTYRRSDDGVSMVKFSHEPNLLTGDRGPIVAYYAAARLDGGEVQFAPISKADMDAFRERFAPRDRNGKITGPWDTDPDAMALKTCLRRLWNLLPAGATKEARRLQEIAAEEAEEETPALERMEVVGELPMAAPESEPPRMQSRVASVKDKLKAKAAPAEPPPEQSPAPAEEITAEEAEEIRQREVAEAEATASEDDRAD